jgi:hypothetical protein
MNPFAVGRATLFAGPRSTAAVYQAAGGAPVELRVIPVAGDVITDGGAGRTIQASRVFEMPIAASVRPRQGDLLSMGGAIVDGEIVGGELLTLWGDAVRDTEGTAWLVGAEPYS